MRGKFAAVGLSLAVAGCATFSNIEQGLQAMVGRPRSEAFARLGYPNGQVQLGNDTAYVWGNSQSFAMPVQQNTYTQGYAGSTPFSATTSGVGYVPMNYNCTIRVIVGPDDYIKAWDYQGNLGGCSGYAGRLKPR